MKIIVGDHFKQDNNHWIQDIQSLSYHSFLSFILTEVKDRFRYAQQLLNIEHDLTTQLCEISSTDQRVFMDFYNILAVRYRLKLQKSDFFDVANLQAQLTAHRQQWARWYVQEVRELLEYGQLCRTIALMFCFQSQKKGYDAEDTLCRYLVAHYHFYDQCPTSYLVSAY